MLRSVGKHGTLHHIKRPEELFKEYSRVLKEKGEARNASFHTTSTVGILRKIMAALLRAEDIGSPSRFAQKRL